VTTSVPDPAQPTRQARDSGIPDNVAAGLAYLFGPFTGILFFILDRDRPLVRFHALQAIGLTIVWIPIWVGLLLVGALPGVIPVLGLFLDALLGMVVGLAGFALWLWLMFQGWSGTWWEVPIVGPQARRISDSMEKDAHVAAS
jgi:uncharacterized membrane protein